MKVESLEVSRRPSYDSDFPNQLVGTVRLKGPSGSLTVVLSNMALSKVFGVISAEVAKTANFQASQVSSGMENAAHEALVVESSKVELLS